MKDEYNAFISECDIGGGDGELAGMKVGVKDNISTKGVETTCGSRVLKGYVPPYDATAVKCLKEEGAEIVGKTNMDEFGMGTTTETSAYGPTKNPADTDYVPGGSSGGSAAAVAAGLVDAALGTDTGGSIRCPASFCGIVGIKPTYGLVSRYGLIAYANSLETIGPMGNTVEDVARLLEVIAGEDPNDSTSRGEPKNYIEHLEEGGGMDGLEIGIPEQLVSEGVDEDVLEKFWGAIEGLEDEGASYHKVSIDSLEYALAAYYVIAMGEASSNLARYDGVRYGPPGDSSNNWNESFAEVRARFGEEVKRRVMLGTYALSAGYYGKYYQKAQNARELVRSDINDAFEDADVLASPTMPVKPFRIGETIDDPMQMYLADVNTVPVNMAGVPSISLPAGEADGLPVGLQLIGPKFSETQLLRTGNAFLN